MQRRRRRLGALFIFLALIAGSGWLLGWSPFLTVKQIEVVGLAPDSPLKSESIIALSGIRIGEPMARVNGPSLRRQLDQLPRIGGVWLIRKWPHRLVVRIRERVPVVAIVKGTEFQLVDSKSNEYAMVATVPSGVPTMTVMGDYKLAVKTGMSVITQLPAGIMNRITEISSSGADGLQFTMAGGVKIIWGSSEDLALKTRVLSTLLTGSGANHVKIFDVSAPYAPTTK